MATENSWRLLLAMYMLIASELPSAATRESVEISGKDVVTRGFAQVQVQFVAGVMKGFAVLRHAEARCSITSIAKVPPPGAVRSRPVAALPDQGKQPRGFKVARKRSWSTCTLNDGARE